MVVEMGGDSVSNSSQASTARVRKRRRQHSDRRAMRTETLAMLSAARQSLGDDDTFCRNLRSARKGAAPGLSG